MKFAIGPSFRAHGSGGWPLWWSHRGFLAIALLPLAGVFGIVAAMRRLAYRNGWLRCWRAPVPVIVVGNVTAGGAGKTPVVLAIAQCLRKAGWTPGIVSRGYGRDSTAPECLEVLPNGQPRMTGDEPLLLARYAGCPVWVGRDRPDAARALLNAHPQVDVLLSDDGLQHLALARDVELVVVDARGAGNGWLLPAGPLREGWHRPRSATLGPAEALDGRPVGAPGFAVTRRLGTLLHLASGERLAVDAFVDRHAGVRVAAAAGIGNPRQFFDMLRDAGVPLTTTLPLPDHFRYTVDPFATVDAAAILVTEKDALKCQAPVVPLDRLWAVELQVDINAAFFPWLLAQLLARTEDLHGSTSA